MGAVYGGTQPVLRLQGAGGLTPSLDAARTKHVRPRCRAEGAAGLRLVSGAALLPGPVHKMSSSDHRLSSALSVGSPRQTPIDPQVAFLSHTGWDRRPPDGSSYTYTPLDTKSLVSWAAGQVSEARAQSLRGQRPGPEPRAPAPWRQAGSHWASSPLPPPCEWTHWGPASFRPLPARGAREALRGQAPPTPSARRGPNVDPGSAGAPALAGLGLPHKRVKHRLPPSRQGQRVLP